MHRAEDAPATVDPLRQPSAPTAQRSGEALRNVLRNLARLLAGRAVSALLLLLATALMARALPPAEFGLVVLLHTYALVWNGLFNCKPFEAIIRYGVPALDAGDEPRLRRLLRLSLIVDALTSLFAALCACAGAALVGPRLGWDAEFIGLAQVYSLVLLTGVTGTSKGILRLFNRFDLLSRQLAIGALLRCAGVACAWYLELGMQAFALAWGVALCAEQLYMMQRGWRELRRQLREPSLRGLSLAGWRSEFPGIAGFINVVYWQSNLDLLPKHVSTLVVGAFLGPAGAGLFRIARELSAALATPAVLLRQVLFPDLTRLWNRGGGGLGWLLARTLAGAAACGFAIVLLCALAGERLLGLLAGPDYAAAAPVLTWLLVAGTLDICANVLRAAGYAMGDAGAILRLNTVATVVYVLVFLAATRAIGLHGAGIAACVAAAITLSGTLLLVRQRWRERASAAG